MIDVDLPLVCMRVARKAASSGLISNPPFHLLFQPADRVQTRVYNIALIRSPRSNGI